MVVGIFSLTNSALFTCFVFPLLTLLPVGSVLYRGWWPPSPSPRPGARTRWREEVAQPDTHHGSSVHTAFHTVVVNPTGVRSVPLCHHTGYCSLLMSPHLLLVNSNVIWLVIGPAARLQTSFRGALSGGVWWVAGLLPLLSGA